MPLNEISLAISPYIARVGKAIQFYKNNVDKTKNSGLMLCIAEGPTGGWPLVNGDEVAPLPELITTQLENIIGFKRYKNMYFVVANTAGDLSVGGITWQRITAASDEDLYAEALNRGARWLYIEAELDTTELEGEVYRQVGLYSEVKINTLVANPADSLFTPDKIIPNSGILEVYQNKYPVIRPAELKEIFTWVLEF